MKKKLSKVTTPVSAKMEKKEPLRSILKKEVCMPPPVNAWKARDEVRRLPCALFLREFVCVWSGPCARVLRSASAARAASAACRCRSRVAHRKTYFGAGASAAVQSKPVLSAERASLRRPATLATLEKGNRERKT